MKQPVKKIDPSELGEVSGGAYGQSAGPATYRPELAGMRQVFDDGSTLSVSPSGWMSATEGLGPREALLQYRTEGPGMSINSMQSLADNRGVDFLVNNPDIDTVHIQTSGLTFNSLGQPVESVQSGATTRASMGQIFDDGSRLLDAFGETRPTQSFDGLQEQIEHERAEAGLGNDFSQASLPGWTNATVDNGQTDYASTNTDHTEDTAQTDYASTDSVETAPAD